MDKKVMKYLGNPVVSQLLLAFGNEELSAKDLRSKLPDVPPATLYRQVKKLHEEGILTMVAEKQNRGSVEKIYALAVELKTNDVQELSQLTPQHYYELFADFTWGLLSEFSEYAKRDEADVANDGTGFSVLPIYATKEELEEYGKAIKAILAPALVQQHADQQRHSFALIVTPPKE